MDRATAMKFNSEMNEHFTAIQEAQKKLNGLVAQRAKILAQHNENDMVAKELEVMEDDQPIYKLLGPVLIKQDLGEAKMNVANRLKFFQSEIDRFDRQEKEFTEDLKKHREQLMTIQESVRKIQQEAVQKSLASQQASQAAAQ